jgi:Family of unknown function (DUF6200)
VNENPGFLEDTSMAQAPSAAEQREQRDQRAQRDPAKPELVIVDLGKRQRPKQVRRLRKGRGKLVRRIDAIVDELIQAGTVKANAQPVVIVVREEPPMPWPFGSAAYDDDDDDD